MIERTNAHPLERRYGLLDLEVENTHTGEKITYLGFVAEGATFTPHPLLGELFVAPHTRMPVPVMWRMTLRDRHGVHPTIEVVQEPAGHLWPVGDPVGASLPIHAWRLALASSTPGLVRRPHFPRP